MRRRAALFGAGGFSPNSISSLRLWLRPDSLSASADGDPVTTWSDESGQGNHATQSTGASKPSYRTGLQNGQAGVRFDGSDDFLALTASIDVFNCTLMLVTKMFDDGNNRGPWLGTSTGPATVFVNDADRYSLTGAGANINDTAPTTYTLVDLQVSTTAGTVCENGASVGTFAGTFNSTANWLGKGFLNRVLWAEVLELIYCNAVLSAGDLATLRAYLNRKYALY